MRVRLVVHVGHDGGGSFSASIDDADGRESEVCVEARVVESDETEENERDRDRGSANMMSERQTVVEEGSQMPVVWYLFTSAVITYHHVRDAKQTVAPRRV